MRKFVSIFLITLLLFGSLRVSVATHFCGGLAVKQAFMVGHHKLDCGMPEMDRIKSVADLNEVIIQAEACCENEYQNFEIDSQFRPSIVQSPVNVDFVFAFVAVVFTNEAAAQTLQPSYANYTPPPIERDIPVLIQSFLI